MRYLKIVFFKGWCGQFLPVKSFYWTFFFALKPLQNRPSNPLMTTQKPPSTKGGVLPPFPPPTAAIFDHYWPQRCDAICTRFGLRVIATTGPILYQKQTQPSHLREIHETGRPQRTNERAWKLRGWDWNCTKLLASSWWVPMNHHAQHFWKTDQDQMEVIVEVVSSESKPHFFFLVAFFGVGPRKPMFNKKGN